MSLHCFHIVLRQQWDFQNFGVGDDGLMACRRNGLASDTMDLIESMRSQQAIVCRADEQLEGEWLAL